MIALLRSVRSIFPTICNGSGRCKARLAALLFMLPVLCSLASAQTTTISGTVYDPRTTASALPLSNVLVYVTTDPVPALPSGSQCLTTSTPTSAVSYTNTAVDGTFTLGNIPVNTDYTLVIQAGKWRRQFDEPVAATPLTGLLLHMPANHTQGDIPMIAIATGAVDGLECVLRDMGIADTEFTDDNGTVNPGGHIHLYKGVHAAGADISASTPSESVLMGTPADSSLLNSYDMVMFPCQGGAITQTSTALNNLMSYANAGGRVFTTHYSYDRLDPDSPYNSPFPAVANWDVGQTNPSPDPGIATVQTNFTDGGLLAQWLQNAGASYQNTPGQVQISTLRHDFNGVIAPTQSWLTLNNTTAGNPVMQMTFNTPVGSPAAQQCGRVLFTEYHVMNASSNTGKAFPSECATGAAMSAQEEMLEYALFDLSTFVQPVVVPTLTATFTPSPLVVKQGDTADPVTVTATNTSTTVNIDSSAVLTITLPAYLTATSITDSTGGWICTLGTLTCTRTSFIGSSASDPVTLTVSVGAYPQGFKGSITATISSPTFSNNVTATDAVVYQQTPTVSWATPAPIVYGTALGAAQLDATASVPGTFAYSPAAGTVPAVGQQTLTTSFTPTDAVDYLPATGSTTLTVIQATPAVSLAASASPAFLSNPITFTATVSSSAITPTGSVTFYDGTSLIGTGVMSSGQATVTTSSLTMGSHTISAVYSGDTSYGPATSGNLPETIQDFTFALSGNSTVTGTATASNGGQAVYPFVVAPVGGATLPAAISFSVTGLPLDATAVFSPVTVAANSGAANVTLQVSLPGHAAKQTPLIPLGKGALPVALGLILLPFAGRLRKARATWCRLVLLAVTSAVLAVGLTGCQVTVSPQSFSLTVTASSGPLSHTTTVKLIVQ